MQIKAARTTLTLLIALAAVSVFAETHPPVTAPLRSALVRAKQVTNVPILLPSSLPALIEGDTTLVSFGDGNKDSYDISLYQSDGDGGTTIFVGDFTGDVHYKHAPNGRPVRLIDHVTGHFLPRSCGGSCAPSSIEWSVKGIHYKIQLKFGFDNERVEQETMVDAANSAIAAGAR